MVHDWEPLSIISALMYFFRP